jgi:hypothetical protein
MPAYEYAVLTVSGGPIYRGILMIDQPSNLGVLLLLFPERRSTSSEREKIKTN